MKLLGGPSLALLGGRIPCQNLRHRLLPTGLAQTILARMVPMIHGIGTNPGEVTLPRWEEFALVNKEVLVATRAHPWVVLLVLDGGRPVLGVVLVQAVEVLVVAPITEPPVRQCLGAPLGGCKGFQGSRLLGHLGGLGSNRGGLPFDTSHSSSSWCCRGWRPLGVGPWRGLRRGALLCR